MKPMLCESETPYNAKAIYSSAWLCEEKYDGVRAYILNGHIFSRSGRIITKQFPEFDTTIFPKDHIIDGEILCEEDFSKTQSRVLTTSNAKIRLMSKHMPAKFYAFDYIQEIGNTPLEVRKQNLKKAVKDIEWIEFVQHGNFQEMWEYVLKNAKEGVVLKRKDSWYQFGRRSPDWIKVKAFVETEAVFTKLEKHNKGVRLETPDGKSVNVNGHQAILVEQEFNRKKYVKCEVQFMEIEDSDAWRFPSFRGLK